MQIALSSVITAPDLTQPFELNFVLRTTSEISRLISNGDGG